jgi:hypothetical protein
MVARGRAGSIMSVLAGRTAERMDEAAAAAGCLGRHKAAEGVGMGMRGRKRMFFFGGVGGHKGAKAGCLCDPNFDGNDCHAAHPPLGSVQPEKVDGAVVGCHAEGWGLRGGGCEGHAGDLGGACPSPAWGEVVKR